MENISVQPAVKSLEAPPPRKAVAKDEGTPLAETAVPSEPEVASSSVSPPTPKSPPQVEHIRKAVETSVEQKRPFLAVLSYPPRENKDEIDLFV